MNSNDNFSKKTSGEKPVLGQIGMGWIGKNYAEDFERRGYKVICYSLEPEFSGNKEKIKDCDIVFIAVPTPTTAGGGFNFDAVRDALRCVGSGKIAVVKSTILPGTTDKLQEEFPDIYLMHSPEFLTEKTAEYDVANPSRNIIGVTKKSFNKRANEVMRILPPAPYEEIMPAKEAELVKYGGNCWFYLKVIFMNLLYDLAGKLDVDFETVKDAMAADRRIGKTHLDVVHQGGRGAGGHCFIKDMAAFAGIYQQMLPGDANGIEFLMAAIKKNYELLKESGKDEELRQGVYGN